MLVLRPTQALAKRLKVELAPIAQDSTTILGDWYCQLLHTRPKQLILAVSEKSRLPVLFHAANDLPFHARLGLALARVLEALEVAQPVIEAELREMQTVAFMKTANRSILGTINDFTFALEVAPDKTFDLLEGALWLADTPCRPLGGKSPEDVTRELLGAPPTPRRPLFPPM